MTMRGSSRCLVSVMGNTLSSPWTAPTNWPSGCCTRSGSWTRYYALNLHAVFYRGTVEFRCFNSTLHADRAAAYINLCLAMSAQAINQRSAIMQKTHSDNELFTFRVWLVRLGLNGPEFKNTRDILLTNLDGDRAWRYDKDSYEVNKRKRQHREMER
nr:amidoligase family protein [Oscillibacter sp.]